MTAKAPNGGEAKNPVLGFWKTGGANLHQQEEKTEGFVLTENQDKAYWPNVTLFGRRPCCFGAGHYITGTWAVHSFELMQLTLFAGCIHFAIHRRAPLLILVFTTYLKNVQKVLREMSENF